MEFFGQRVPAAGAARHHRHVANHATGTHWPLTFPQRPRRKSGHPAALERHFQELAANCGFVTVILQCNV
jgi:hypothetical protein